LGRTAIRVPAHRIRSFISQKTSDQLINFQLSDKFEIQWLQACASTNNNATKSPPN